MKRVLLFAGTTEGRLLSEAMVKAVELPSFAGEFIVSVATDYGRELLPENKRGFFVSNGRLHKDGMKNLILNNNIDMVIDGTHPYAKEVSQNIEEITKEMGLPKYRLTRDSEELTGSEIYVENMDEAAEFLMQTEGKVLLTTGIKELRKFTSIKDFQERLFPRILPSPEGIGEALDLGYKKQNIICMQGPFNLETNIGMLKQINAKYLVSKESGKIGGFPEKREAAKRLGVQMILVGRPSIEETVTIEQAMKLCEIPESVLSEFKKENQYEVKEDKEWETTGSRFPLYVNLENKKVLVVGAGQVAMRRAKVLMGFNCKIQMVAKDFPMGKPEGKGFSTIEREFLPADVNSMDLVIAATDRDTVNKEIWEACKERKILVNVASDKKLCDFYFPGIVRAGDMVVGVIAGGKNHKKAAQARKAIAEVISKLEY